MFAVVLLLTSSLLGLVLPRLTTAVTVTPLQYGAVGDGVTDDSAALQRAFTAAGVGGTVVLPAGRVFAHRSVLKITIPQLRLTGPGSLRATNESTSSVWVMADGVRIDNTTLSMASTTKRWVAYEQMKLRLGRYTGISVTDVTIDGSAAAGVFVGGANKFTLTRLTVRNTRADGIQMTEGASNGTVIAPNVNRSGDDGVSVVSYKDSPLCARITVSDAVVTDQQWGRAYAVVGGTDITWNNPSSTDSAAAAMYIAAEPSYNTLPVSNVVVTGGTFVRSNRNSTVDHGAVLVYNGQTGTANTDITMTNLTIINTRGTASRDVGIFASSGASNTRISLGGVNVTDGPRTTLATNAASTDYSAFKWTKDGVALSTRGVPHAAQGPVPAGGVLRVPTRAPNTTVMLNVTAVAPASSGYTTVYPCDRPRPATSNTSYRAGQVVGNYVLTRTAADGTVCVFTSASSDFTVDQSAQTAAVTAGDPVRVFDSRSGAKPAAATVVRIPTGKASQTVLGNLTVVAPTGAGTVKAYPCDAPVPAAPLASYSTRETVASFTAARTDSTGAFCVLATASAHILFDLQAASVAFTTGTPRTVLDTTGQASPPPAGTTFTATTGNTNRFELTTLAAVPTSSAGYTVAYSCPVPAAPAASSLNFPGTRAAANMAGPQTDTGGRVCLRPSTAANVVVAEYSSSSALTGYSPVRRADTRF